jgi:hypothetical protein
MMTGLPSITTATAEFVVPRSIPTERPVDVVLLCDDAKIVWRPRRLSPFAFLKPSTAPTVSMFGPCSKVTRVANELAEMCDLNSIGRTGAMKPLADGP